MRTTRRGRRSALGLLALSAAACPGERAAGPPATPSPAPRPAFEDRATAAGIDHRNLCGHPDKPYIVDAIGAGACWLDADRDGRLDLFVVQGSHWAGKRPDPVPGDRLYHNLGSGRFADVTDAAGIREADWGGGCAVGDVDNDGWPDLFVTNHGPNRLWRNRGGGTFEDFTLAAGVSGDGGWGSSAAFADLDGDGDLDLVHTSYVAFDWNHPPRNGGANFCTWHAVEVFCGPRGLGLETPTLYRNNGDGSFSDRSEASGLLAAAPTYGLGVVPVDFDLDGDLDLYMANDARPNQLWHNLGDLRFEDIALRAGAAVSDTGKEQAGMGVDAGDYDGDGWPDLFVTNFSEDWFTLYRNDRGDFADVSMVTGVAIPTFAPLGWGTRFFDFDDDGDLDILAANGHTYPQVDSVATSPPVTWRQRPNLLRNDGGKFTDVAAESGPGFEALWTARGAAVGDYDSDGRLDVALVNIDGPLALLHNSGDPRHNWLGVVLEGRESNRDAIGARLVLEAPGLPPQTRWAVPSGSFQSCADPRVHFGLAGAVRADLSVHWPSGARTRLAGLDANRYWRVVEGEAEAVALAPPTE